MSVSLNIEAFTGKDSPELKKHLEAIKFCLKNDLSLPNETLNYLVKNHEECKDSVEFDIHDENDRDWLLNIYEDLEKGIKVKLPFEEINEWEYKLNIKKIPKEVDYLIIKIDY